MAKPKRALCTETLTQWLNLNGHCVPRHSRTRALWAESRVRGRMAVRAVRVGMPPSSDVIDPRGAVGGPADPREAGRGPDRISESVRRERAPSWAEWAGAPRGRRHSISPSSALEATGRVRRVSSRSSFWPIEHESPTGRSRTARRGAPVPECPPPPWRWASSSERASAWLRALAASSEMARTLGEARTAYSSFHADSTGVPNVAGE